MSKGKDSKKTSKKTPSKTMKEKKAAKEKRKMKRRNTDFYKNDFVIRVLSSLFRFII